MSLIIQVDYKSFTSKDHLQVNFLLKPQLLITIDVDSRQVELNIMSSLVWFQMGEGFGWSVAACDLNGDGLDDLIAGSPMYRCIPIWIFS